MKYQHPSIVIETPALGHYVIKGHKPRSVFIPDEGHLVPPHEVHISPEVPSDALLAILAERGDKPAGGTAAQKARIAELEKQLDEAMKTWEEWEKRHGYAEARVANLEKQLAEATSEVQTRETGGSEEDFK